jgi:hypothetical protein
MFPVSSHTAEKVQNDINVIVNAIAQWLAKVKLEWPQTEQDGELPPVQWNAELVHEPVLDLDALPDRQTLPSHDLGLLPGKDFWLLTPVQLQIGTTTIAGLFPEVREQLNQLPPERIAALRAAIEQPTGTRDSGETLEIQVNDATALRRNGQGQMEINELQAKLEQELSQAKTIKGIELESEIATIPATQSIRLLEIFPCRTPSRCRGGSPDWADPQRLQLNSSAGDSTRSQRISDRG